MEVRLRTNNKIKFQSKRLAETTYLLCIKNINNGEKPKKNKNCWKNNKKTNLIHHQMKLKFKKN